MSTGGAMATALDNVIHLDVILDAVLAKHVPLAAETAGYLLLDLAGACSSDQLLLEPTAVVVSEEGVVAVVHPLESTDPQTEASLRALLGRLLAAGGSSTPALQAAAERAPEGQRELFVGELEAALIPLNRSAGRRAVARLAREARRVSMGIGRHGALTTLDKLGRPSTPPPPLAVDDVPMPASDPDLLDGLKLDIPRIEPLAPPPAAMAAEADLNGARTPPRIDISELPAQVPVERPSYSSEIPEAPRDLAPAPMAPPAPAVETPQEPVLSAPQVLANAGADHVELTDPAPVTVGSHSLRLPGIDGSTPSGELSFDPREHTARLVTERTDALVQDARKSPWRFYVAGALALLAAGVAVGLKVAARGEGTGSDAVVSAFRAGVRGAQPVCEATLTAEGIPLGAELFRRMGAAPIDVPRMPVGARLEWVAIADGFRVRRAVIPAGALWNHGGQGSRYELAIQLDVSAGRGLEPWPSAEPGPQVGGAGNPGVVHLVTSPPGAEIFLFSGVAPEATLAALGCDESYELLLAGPRDERRRIVVGSSEFVKTTDGTTGIDKRAARVRLNER